jgi:hypothetical protein
VKALIVDEPHRMSVGIVLYHERDDGVRLNLVNKGDGIVSWEVVQPGEIMRDYISFGALEWAALLAEINPPVEGAAQRIEREQQLSDRLLGMIEREWNTRIIEKEHTA